MLARLTFENPVLITNTVFMSGHAGRCLLPYRIEVPKNDYLYA
jgi:hypothetical protein